MYSYSPLSFISLSPLPSSFLTLPFLNSCFLFGFLWFTDFNWVFLNDHSLEPFPETWWSLYLLHKFWRVFLGGNSPLRPFLNIQYGCWQAPSYDSPIQAITAALNSCVSFMHLWLLLVTNFNCFYILSWSFQSSVEADCGLFQI